MADDVSRHASARIPRRRPRREATKLPPLQGAAVLVVDDDPFIRKLVTHLLQHRGYRVHDAPNGESALAVLGENGDGIDLLLTDMTMPAMDGHTLARRVRESHPHIPVVYMTGGIPDSVVLKKEVSPVLEKPFRSAQLYRMVASALETGPPQHTARRPAPS